jgi:hypothetical protein
MQQSNRAQWLKNGAAILGVEIEAPCEVHVDKETIVKSVARFPAFGGDNGILVFSKFEQVKPYWRQLADLGFGFAVLDEMSDERSFDLDAFRAMLIDWGWLGDRGDQGK